MRKIKKEESRNIVGGYTYVCYCPGYTTECKRVYKDKNGKLGIFKASYKTIFTYPIAYYKAYTSACNCLAYDLGI